MGFWLMLTEFLSLISNQIFERAPIPHLNFSNSLLKCQIAAPHSRHVCYLYQLSLSLFLSRLYLSSSLLPCLSMYVCLSPYLSHSSWLVTCIIRTHSFAFISGGKSKISYPLYLFISRRTPFWTQFNPSFISTLSRQLEA